MKPYPKYKDSGIEWIGAIPEGWEIKKFKYLYHSSMGNTLLKTDLNPGGKIPVFSATESDAIFGFVDHAEVILEKGDFVIPARGNSIGHIMLVNEKSTCTQTTIYAKKHSQLIGDKFSYYYQKGLKLQLFQFDQTAIPQITVAQIKENPFIIPPSIEQTAIAFFLDRKTAEIDGLIARKEWLIELYEEEKTAMINQAVTKGLDPDATMKPSGIDWLGDIPDHWEIKRLKYVAKIIGGYAFSSNDFTPIGMQLLKIANLYQNQLHLERQPTFISLNDHDKYKQWIVTKGDILMSMTGTLGKMDYGFAILMETDDQYLLNQRVSKIYNVIGIVDKFMIHVLRSDYFLHNLFSKQTGTKQGNLSNEQVVEIKIVYPSTTEEQNKIVGQIESECSQLDTIIEKFHKQIELLKEYRTALIYEVVTGKIDVRDEVAQ